MFRLEISLVKLNKTPDNLSQDSRQGGLKPECRPIANRNSATLLAWLERAWVVFLELFRAVVLNLRSAEPCETFSENQGTT